MVPDDPNAIWGLSLESFVSCFFKYFERKKDMESTQFGKNMVNSKKVQTNIGIRPQALIRHFNPIINNKNPKKTEQIQLHRGRRLTLFGPGYTGCSCDIT